jgi:hypothetical protein
MFLFRKRVKVEAYCDASLAAVCLQEREITWEKLRLDCDDPALSRVDAQLYYAHLRAIFIQLMFVGIAKNFGVYVSSDAGFFTTNFLKNRGLAGIDEIVNTYSQAFASGGDGVSQIVLHFSDFLTDARLKPATLDRLYVEFYAILKVFFDDFRKIKLVTSN